jgi:hypothetical protein
MKRLWMLALLVWVGLMPTADAADLQNRNLRTKAAVRVVVADEVDCIRWVRQTQSWYNYCEPIPYYGLPPSHWDWAHWDWVFGNGSRYR